MGKFTKNNPYQYKRGHIHPPEVREKIRQSKLGRKNPMYGKKSWNTGVKMSKEYCQKLSEAHTGIIPSTETRKRMSKAQKKIGNRPPSCKGRKLTKEHKAKLSKFHTGKIVKLSTRKKLSAINSGISLSKWKGFIESKNYRIRKSAKYFRWRQKVFKRDNFKCQMPDCNSKECYIQANHIKKFSKFPKLRFTVNNGITLCKKCHNKVTWQEEKYEKLFEYIVKKNANLYII